MMRAYNLRVRKEVEGEGVVTISLWVDALSKNQAERKLKALVHPSWRWIEFVKPVAPETAVEK